MRTYRELFAVREYRLLFGTAALGTGAGTIERLALATVVFERTGSPLLAALAFLAGVLPAAVGALTLMSLADRVRPRTFFVGMNVLRCAAVLILATGAVPVWGMLLIVMAVGLVASVGAGVSGGLLRDVVGSDGYALARSTFGVLTGSMQILGFAVGGVLLATLSPRVAFLTVAALTAMIAVLCRLGLHDRGPRASGRGSLQLTHQGNARLLGRRGTRSLLLAAWVPNGLVVGAEALYVPHAGAGAAGLFVAAAFGMLVGDLLVGRFVPHRLRFRLVVPLRLLLAVPYLVFWADPPQPVAVLCVGVASAGFAASIALSERLLEVTPDDLQAQALGLSSSGMVTSQALGALIAGAVAEALGTGPAMTVVAAISALVTLTLVPGLRSVSHPTADTPTQTHP
ncbi:MAG: MFS transporter [Actinomycetota bacterium]|nr:MFS transporter [Actinomycetota bacterium]